MLRIRDAYEICAKLGIVARRISKTVPLRPAMSTLKEEDVQATIDKASTSKNIYIK